MRYALYGLVAAALVAISSGCASPCFGPQSPILGGGCTGSCGGSALDTMFGGGGCDCRDGVAAVGSGCTNVATDADGGCQGGCRGAGCAACVGAPIIDSGRRRARAADGTVVGVGDNGGRGGLLNEIGLLGGRGGAAGCIGGGAGGAVHHIGRSVVNLPHHLQNGCVNGTCGQVMGPTAGMVQYPYYTTRGPRDFLLASPPSIGP